MIDAKLAKRILRPLLSMAMAPKDTGEIDQRIAALAKFSHDEGHARRVCLEIRDREEYFPTVNMLIDRCKAVPDHKLLATERLNCPHCHGEGMISVDGPFGISAALTCDHTGNFGNKGVRIPAAVQSHYMREFREAEERRAAWDTNPANPLNRTPRRS